MTGQVTVQLAWQPRGVREDVGNVLGDDNRQVQRDFTRFKHFIEERGTPTGAWRGEVDQPATS